MATSTSSVLSGPPAILGGVPAFPQGLPFVRPTVPPEEAVLDRVRTVLRTGVMTNGPFVRELEERAANYLGVGQCVAVSSCTSGLMLVLRASELTGDVVLPSFTFAATAHAVAWNQLRPVFADIDPATLTLSPEAAASAVGVRTSAILATHTFGTPCDTEALTAAARSNGIKLFFDAAHAFGSRRKGTPVGRFGDAEVFSLSPTKVLVAAEGGIIATNDDLLAERCRMGRDYANPGDYDCRFVGLNARMSEVHAAIALASLEGLDERIDWRNQLVAWYREALSAIPGVGFPVVPEPDRSTYKDFTILVEPEGFGIDAASLAAALAAEGIQTRRYYTPPVHAMRAYRTLAGTNGDLPVTERVSALVLTLPLWGAMTEDHIWRVASATDRIHRFLGGRKLRPEGAEKIRQAAEEDRPLD
jgi:dTDP-4-amino-4,6-dideoxygalactose transaminase